MLPFVTILGRSLPMYGLLGLLGFLLGLLFVILRAPRFSLSRDDAAYIHIRLHSQQLINPVLNNPKDLVSWMGSIQAQDYTMSK